MADFEIRAANDGTDADDSAVTDEPGNFWVPADHMDKLHLIASRPGREIEVETKFGAATPALADVVVVFADDQKTWSTFKNVRVFPVVLRRKVLEGGVIAGTVLKDQSKSGNPVWIFGDIDAAASKFLAGWAEEHLIKNDGDGSYGLVGSEGSSNSLPNEPTPSGDGASPEEQIEPDEEPF